MIGVGVEQAVQVPAPVLREVRDRVACPRRPAPTGLRGPHAAGEPAAHPHDGDGTVVLFLNLAKAPACLTQVSGDKLEVIAKLIFVSHLHSPFMGRR